LLRALDCSATFGDLTGGAASYIYDTFIDASGDTSLSSLSMTRRCAVDHSVRWQVQYYRRTS
jgi:hypothetical protein